MLLGNSFTIEKIGLRLEQSNPNFYIYCNTFLGNSNTLRDIERTSGSWVNQRAGCPNINFFTVLPSNTFTYMNPFPASFYNVYTGSSATNSIQYFYASPGTNYDPQKSNAPNKFAKSVCAQGAENCTIGGAEAIVDKSLEDLVIGYFAYKNQIDSLMALSSPTADETNELQALQSEIKPYLYFVFNKYIENSQTTEALSLLAADSSFYAKKLLCDYYINIDSLTAALYIVSTIAALNSTEQEIIDFCELYPIIISALQTNDYWLYMQAHKTNIETIADRGQTFFAIQAQGIYNYQSLIYDYANDNDSEFTTFAVPYPMPEPEVIEYETEDNVVENNTPLATIAISPNPVSETFVATINNNTNTGTLIVKITDVYGVIKYTGIVSMLQNQMQTIPIDFSNEIAGAYMAKIELNGVLLSSTVFVKQ